MRIAILTSDNREMSKDYANPYPRIGVAPEALLEGLSTIGDIDVHVISCLQAPVQPTVKWAENITCHFLHVPKIGWLRTGYQGCIRAVRTKLRALRPDIVHGQGTERDCALSAVLSGFPNVVTIHGNMRALARFYRAKPGSYFWLAARLESFVLPRTTGVFCNSRYTENLVRSSVKEVWRAPNALRKSFFDTPFSSQPKFPPVLLNVGTIAPHKRQVELLQLARRLWQQGLVFQMHFVGSTVENDSYCTQFFDCLADGVKDGYACHTAALSARQLIETMDHASALVHMPLEESFGLVVGEALARNLALFAADIGGIADVVAGVEGAELVRFDDWAGLECALTRWIKKGCPRLDAAHSTREHFHPEVVALRHLNIYREVLASQHK